MRTLGEKLAGVLASALLITVLLIIIKAVALIIPATWSFTNMMYVASGILGLLIVVVNWEV